MSSLTTIHREIKQLKSFLQVNDMVSEKEAAAILGITEKTLREKICRGEVPTDYYTVNALGKRNYFKSKLLGL